MCKNECLTLEGWHEEHLLVKAEFELDILSDEIICNVIEDEEKIRNEW